MKKNIKTAFSLLISISFLESMILIKSTNAFFPKINEPNEKELKTTSIKIGKTAVQLIQLGQNNAAIKLLNLGIKLNPKEYALWISLAEAQIRADKNEEAVQSLNKAIEINPKKESIYFTKASVYMNLKNPKKSIEAINQGLLKNKNSERGYFLLGNAEIMLKNYNSALIAFKKSSKINSTFWQAINNEGLILYELNNPQKAISKFKSALEISQNAEPMLALAIVLFLYKNNQIESIQLAKNALISNPKYVYKEYQKEQLWGKKLQQGAQILFKSKEMIQAVKEAKEKSQ